MFDARLLPLQHRLMQPPARALHAIGLTADQVTLFGFMAGILALPAIWVGAPGAALLFIFVNRLADGIDGALARIQGPTDRGAFLDITLDFLFYALVPLGFALMDPTRNALPAAVLLTSFIAAGSSFLAYALMAQRLGLSATAYPGKGIAYLGGLTEGAETIVLFVVICLWPSVFPAMAYLFAAAAMVTSFSRWTMGWTQLRP